MRQTRRSFLQTGTAAIGAATLLPARWAAASVTMGDMEIFSVSDGNLTLPTSFLLGTMPQDELPGVLAEFGLDGLDQMTPPCNVTVMRQGDRVVLFDTGAGHAFQDSAGQLLDALDTVGIAPDDVTHVVFTHAHPDHLWGVLDDFDDAMFYNAQHMIGQAEWDYWTNPNTVDEIGADRASFAVGAQRRLEAIEENLVFFDDGAEILPGVAARASYGHTPGHMAFELRNGSEGLMVVGDSIGNGHVAFARPQWASGSDQDAETAVRTRQSLLDQLATDQMRLIGYHLPGNGIGRVERKGDSYRFVPEGA